MKIIEVNLEDVDFTEAKIQDDFSEVKIHVAEVNIIKIHIKANIKTIVIKVKITKAIKVYIIIHIEISNREITMANLEAEGRDNYHGHGHGRSNYQGNTNYQYHQYYGHDDEH